MSSSKRTVILFLLCFLKNPFTQCLNIPFFGDNDQDTFLTDNKKLPDANDFLSQLLEIPVDQVIKTAKEFILGNNTDINKVRILLYKENGKYENYTLEENLPIDPSKPIKIVIHGWKSQEYVAKILKSETYVHVGTAEWVKNITNSYHKLGLNQTLALDWSTIADKNYITAAGSVEHVGTELANYFWKKVLKENVNYLNQTHLIGHSLGAQVSSFFGKYIQKVGGGKMIYRISALDAAAPLFEYPIHQSSNNRIDEHDAEFVDGFHTNAGFLGFLSSFGNHDYYISYGGPVQPGCGSLDIMKAFECSHSRSHTVYNLTILNDMYYARHCDSPLLMYAKLCQDNVLAVVGEQANSTDINGQFFIYINGEGKPVYPWK